MVHVLLRLEILYLASDFDLLLRRVEPLNEIDPGSAGQQVLPSALDIQPYRRKHAYSGNDNSTWSAHDYLALVREKLTNETRYFIGALLRQQVSSIVHEDGAAVRQLLI